VLGTVVNTLAIICGSLVGLGLRGGIPDRYKESVIAAIGLAVMLIGVKSALRTDALLTVIVSMALGSLAGEALGIEARLERLGHWIGGHFARGTDGVARGFVTASLVFCVGAMAIVGSLESGLAGNHQTLYAKSLLDGVTSVVFASTLGIGVLFSALSVLVYQGAITLSAAMLKPLLTTVVVEQMTAVGGLLILAIGFNILGVRRLRIGNMLPAILLPLIYDLLRQLTEALF
jgi:uncharacterized membrane protein YqgA involved in biofilm formation